MSAAAVPVIVVGVDGSTGSRDALCWAAEYAKLAGGELPAVASWRWPNYITRIPPGADLAADTARTLHEALTDGQNMYHRVTITLTDGSVKEIGVRGGV